MHPATVSPWFMAEGDPDRTGANSMGETPMEYETITVAVEGAVGTLALDNPAKLNPLSVACLRELADAANWFDGHDEVKVVIVRGNGRAFTAGADLAAFSGGGGPDRAGTDAGRLMAEALTAMHAVTVAAIHGHCVGGGVVLAAACDLRVATDDVRFVIPEVDLGIPLAWGGIPRLVREVGPAATRDLVLTCRPFGAAEAQRAGLRHPGGAPGRARRCGGGAGPRAGRQVGVHAAGDAAGRGCRGRGAGAHRRRLERRRLAGRGPA